MQLRKNKASKNDIVGAYFFFKNKTPVMVAREAVSALLGIPLSKTKKMSMWLCKKKLDRVYINIFDYVVGDYSLQMKTLGELRRRCRQRGYYPKKKAKTEGLKIFLRHLFGFARG